MRQFTSVARVNSLFWITSLNSAEKGSTERVHDDLLLHLNSINLPFRNFEPQNGKELLAYLDAIASAANAGTRPIVHFDTHGSAEQGLYIAASGEFVSWLSLIEKLRAINVITENNLCVVSAACFSLNAIRPLKISDPCPFLLLIAPEHDILFGFIEDRIASFYRDLFNGLDVLKAFEEKLAPALKLFHSERMLAISLTKYIRNYCIGKGGERRRENLLTVALSGGLPNNRHNRRRLRKAAKAFIKPNQGLIDKYVETFLIGKRVRFTIRDLEELARNALA